MCGTRSVLPLIIVVLAAGAVVAPRRAPAGGAAAAVGAPVTRRPFARAAYPSCQTAISTAWAAK